MEKKRFFQEPVISVNEASFFERIEKACEIAKDIGRRTRLPDGLTVGQATMVAIGEAGCGGFDPETRKTIRRVALDEHINMKAGS